MMCVSLYTSRVILNTLGVEDFGIYNVVGGVVAMLGFLNGAMSSSTSRYITFALGKGQFDRLHQIFCVSVNVHFILSVLIVILAETIGLWYFYNKLVMPANRIDAAFWVYQCSVLTTLIMIMSVPYNATIVAHEKMSAFAYVSVFEVLMKLVIVYLLLLSPFDKLIVYSVLLVIVQLIVRSCYTIYCHRHFTETHYRFERNLKLTREMFAFAFWSLWGNMAAVFYTQGLNLMLNAFFGPVVNAARAVSVQVQNACSQFISNFQMALNPQITKSYAKGENEYMFSLIYRSARFSFFLMLIITMPIMIESNKILSLWLKLVPDNTVVFMRLILATSLIYTLSNPLVVLAQATGKVRRYQMVVGGVLLLILPVSYICLYFGCPAWSVFLVHFCVEFFANFIRMYMLKGMMDFSMCDYCKKVLFVVVLVSVLSFIVPVLLYLSMPQSLFSFFVVIISCVVSTSVCSYFFGLSAHERLFVKSKIEVVACKFLK